MFFKQIYVIKFSIILVCPEKSVFMKIPQRSDKVNIRLA
jgi:hypothetical protein